MAIGGSFAAGLGVGRLLVDSIQASAQRRLAGQQLALQQRRLAMEESVASLQRQRLQHQNRLLGFIGEDDVDAAIAGTTPAAMEANFSAMQQAAGNASLGPLLALTDANDRLTARQQSILPDETFQRTLAGGALRPSLAETSGGNFDLSAFLDSLIFEEDPELFVGPQLPRAPGLSR